MFQTATQITVMLSMVTLCEVRQHLQVGVRAPAAGVDEGGGGGGWRAPAAPLRGTPAHGSSAQAVDCEQRSESQYCREETDKEIKR